MKSSLKGPFLVFLVAGLVIGCAASQVKEVNEDASAIRPSFTDDTSRLMARQSLDMIEQRHEDYRIGPGDLLEISIFEWELREETKTATFRVAESGVIALPVMGDLSVGGRTINEIKAFIERRLMEDGLIRKPRVSVDIREFRSKLIAVVGAVRDPGVYTLRQNVTALLDILSLAGGITEHAGCLLYVIRTQPADVEALDTDKTKSRDFIAIDLYELMDQGNLDLNMILQHGDVVHVPEASKFSVIGYVRQPDSFPLTKPTTILEGIALAGGLEKGKASPRSCSLIRHSSDGEVIISLDLAAISKGEEPNIYLLPDDIIRVPQRAWKRIAIGTLDIIKGIFNISYWPIR